MASKFDDIARQVSAEAAYGPVYSAAYGDAIKSAKANELGRSLGLPPEIVEANIPDMTAADTIRKRLAQTQQNSTYARMMASSRFAASAVADDHVPKVAAAIDQHTQDMHEGMSGPLSMALYFGRQLLAGTINTLRTPSVLAKEASDLAPGAGLNMNMLPGPLQMLRPVTKALEVAGPGLRSAEEAAAPDPTSSWLVNAIGSGVYSAPTTIGALGAAAMGAPEIGAAMAATQTNAQSYESGRDAGLTARQAAVYGATDAVIEGVTELGPERAFAKFGGGGFAKKAGEYLLKEVGGEMAATLGQSLDQWYWIDRQKGVSFKQYLSTLPEQEAQTVVAILATTGVTGPVAHMVGKTIERQYSAKAAQNVDKIMEAAAASPTRTANPSDFATALNQVLEDTPAEHLYVPADKVADIFAQKEDGAHVPPIEDDPFWSKYAADVKEGAALGHDVVVPLADAATHLAGTPQWEALKDHVRVSPKGLSLSEARTKAKPEDLDALAGHMSDLVEQAVPRMHAAQAMQIAKQTAENFGYDPEKTDAVNHVIANALFTRFNGENARRAEAGEPRISMHDFAAQWLPQVKKQAQAEYEKAAGTDTLDQNSEAFKKWFGESKVVDEHGTPRVVYHGTSRQFDAFDPAAEQKNKRGNIDGFFFTTSRATADAYGPNIIPAHIRLENPFTVGETEVPQSMVDAYRAELERANPHLSLEHDAPWFEKQITLLRENHKVSTGALNGSGAAYRRVVEAGGFDGLIDGHEHVAFDPTQIKSVDNRGAYDPTDPSIYAQGAGGDNAAAGSVRGPSGLRGGAELLAAATGQELGPDQPITGAPQSLTVPGRGKVTVAPYAPARSAANGYMQQAGRIYQPATVYAKVDPERATRLADAFENMEHAPDDPTVRAAYDAMIDETLEQLRAILETGLQIEFIGEGQEDPYATSPREAILDVTENNHLWVFPTAGGFGQGEVTDSPMLRSTEFFVGGQWLLANDVFRIVHDYFGHIKDGHGFRAEGEENAWQSHAAMYSPLARRAMTTETRGQNSWLNFGPHGEANRSASTEETVFAPQKVGLMPEWASEEGMLAGENSGKEISDVYQPQGRTDLSQLAGERGDEGTGRYANDGLIDGEELAAPPIEADGTVKLYHWSLEPELTETDPAKWGRSGRFLPPEERQRLSIAPGRTYFGLGFGQRGGYKGFALTHHPLYGTPLQHYTAAIPFDKLYDMAGDPDGIRAQALAFTPKTSGGRYKYRDINLSDALPGVDGATLYEHLIRDRGYAGYWIKNDSIGLVAAMFEPVTVAPYVGELTLNQSVEPHGFERVAPFLTEEERSHMRDASKAKLLEIIDTLPKAAEMAAVAHAGRAKKGWYFRSGRAIVDVFGIEDAPRFAALLAALSPQVSVQSNFYNAVKIWTAWNNAGRPTDRAAIVKIMGENVQGDKGIASVLNAWINNSVAALSDKEPGSLKLSGPKVNSFFANLVGVTEEVTNDTWMARYMGLEGLGTGGIRDKNNLYRSMNAVTREAASVLTEKTGQSWEPMEVQETVWSFAKTLYEMRDLAGEDRTMQELLEAGGVTHDDIAATPDFAVLFTDGVFRRILEEGGYGQQVADLESSGRAIHEHGATGAVASGEGSGFAADAYRTHLDAAAGRLEAIRNQRRANFEERRKDARQFALTLNQDVTPSEEVFYSNATRAVENSKQDKASPEQWAALLTPGRTPGIKAEEIEWTGVLDWLKMQKGQVEKAALLQVLRDRGIKVDEVVQGETDPELVKKYRAAQYDGGNGLDYWRVEYKLTGEKWTTMESGFPSEEEAQNAINRVAVRPDTQFQNWSSDPSNNTYRELLITLPMGEGSNPERAPSTHWDAEGVVAHVRFMEKTDAEGKRVLFIEEVQSDWHQKGRDQGYAQKVDPEARAAAELAYSKAKDEEDAASVRLAERMAEVWQQRFDSIKDATIRNAFAESTPQPSVDWSYGALTGDAGKYRDDPEVARLLSEANAARLRTIEAGQANSNLQGERGIPDAPFKSSWPALVMKRTIRWAVDHGADKIAWTTGKEQAERYNLSAATGPLFVRQLGDNFAVKMSSQAADQLVHNKLAHRTLDVHSKVGGEYVEMSPAELKEAFGADIANQITERSTEIEVSREETARLLKQAEKDREVAETAHADAQRKAAVINRAGGVVDQQELVRLFAEAQKHERIVKALKNADEFVIDGEDLNVGGEGMKAFYDRNLVNITNDIIKKYGAKVAGVAMGASKTIAGIERDIASTRERQAARERGLADLRSNNGPATTIADTAGAIEADNKRLADLHEQLETVRAAASEPSHFGFEITDQLRDAAAGGFPLFQGKRGNISIHPGENGLMRSALIRSFEAANFSTAIHELGHFFLEDLKRRALGVNASAQEVNDWNSFKQWAESLGHAVDDSAPIPVPAHEYFARGFERFVWEGKAPSLGLRAVFTRLREFMLSLYRTATSFNSPITPEIREVMGRLLASQQEIDTQRAEMKLVNDKIKGLLSETEQRAYDDLAEETRQDARDKLYERVLSTLRQQKRSQASDQKNIIRTEVESQVGNQPIHRALKLLRVGVPQPDGGFAKAKLDRQWLIDTYGPDIEQQLPKGVPPIISDNDTMDADHIAELTGFGSGDEMIRAMIAQEQQRQAMKESGDKRSVRQREVEDQVEQRAQQEIGDPYAHLEEEAQDAVASDRQADLMSMEVRALGRKTGQKPTPWKMAKEWAKRRIELQSAREAISGTAIQMYARAVTKAGREYEEHLVKGDFEEAFRAKQRQLLNMALMSEAKKAANDVDAAVRRMQKIAKRDTIPSVDQDYLDQAHALLGNVDLKNNYKQSERIAAFSDWHAQQVALGAQPFVPPSYRELLGTKHWSKLTVPELLELDTMVGQIIELGRLKKTLLDAGRQRDFDEAIMEMVGTADTQKRRRDPKTLGERTLPERFRSKLRSADAAMLKVEQMAKWLDGNDPTGPWTRLLFAPLAKAQGRENDLLRAYITEINAIIKGLPSTQVARWQDKVDAPGLINGRVPALFKDQVVMAAMNWGNEGNKQRLLDGYGWEEADVLRTFEQTMSKEDWDFVQQVWDVIDKLWPEVAALERRVNGLSPEKVEAVPVSTPHGLYRGGYFPVIYDPSLSSRAAIDEDNKLSPDGGFMQVTTRAGSTRERAERVTDRPIMLSMGVITRHIGEVIHDITHREAIVNAKKILGDKRIGDSVREHLGPEYLKAMTAWLENIARPGTAFSKAAPWTVAIGRYLNKSVAMVGLGFRVSTAAMQLLGIPVAIGEVGEANITTALRTMIAHPVQSWNEMQARSAYMRSRADSLDATIDEMVHAHHSGKLQMIGPRGLQKYAMQGIAYMDMVVSTTIWTAGFNKALKQGLSEDEATDYADQTVRTTQGGGGQTDRSQIMFEHPMVRSFYAFFSYLNALFNMQRDVFREAGDGHYLEAARKAWWVMLVPMLAQTLIFGHGPPPDDDGEVSLASWLKYLGLQTVVGNLGSIPGVGTLASAVGNGYTYRSSAYNAMGEGLMREAHDIKQVRKGEKEVDGSTVKAAINTVGLVTAQPLGQVGATTGGLYDYAKGNVDPHGAGDWYNLLTKGYIPTH